MSSLDQFVFLCVESSLVHSLFMMSQERICHPYIATVHQNSVQLKLKSAGFSAMYIDGQPLGWNISSFQHTCTYVSAVLVRYGQGTMMNEVLRHLSQRLCQSCAHIAIVRYRANIVIRDVCVPCLQCNTSHTRTGQLEWSHTSYNLTTLPPALFLTEYQPDACHTLAQRCSRTIIPDIWLQQQH